MDRFTKQPYESFTISADFTRNFATDETITSQTVVAQDKDGSDVSNIVVDQGLVTNDGKGTVHVLVQDGSEEQSPYKITVRCETSAGHKWELDVEMKVREI